MMIRVWGEVGFVRLLMVGWVDRWMAQVSPHDDDN